MADDPHAPADERRFSPSVARNRDALFATLSPHLAHGARVLEIASGAGEHAAHFCERRPDLIWTPSDPDPGSRASIAAWRRHVGAPGLLPPLSIDAREADWPGVSPPYNAVVSVNMIHIAPWSACLGLIAGAAGVLAEDGVLALYGPFRRDGVHTAPSNQAFDADLRARNPDWGVRDMGAVASVAQQRGLVLAAEFPMPANNFTLLFKRLAKDV